MYRIYIYKVCLEEKYVNNILFVQCDIIQQMTRSHMKDVHLQGLYRIKPS